MQSAFCVVTPLTVTLPGQHSEGLFYLWRFIMSDKQNNPGNAVTETAKPNPFDPAQLRLSQDFAKLTGVKKLVTTIPVRKPNKQDFIRVHPDAAYCLETAVLEFKEDRETYLVAPELWPELPDELIPKALFTAINRQKVLFIWPIRLPGEDGRHDEWSSSALDAASRGKIDWIRVSSNMSLGAYEVSQATGDLPDPEWPEIDFPKILEIAFKGRFITDMEHPALRRLRGEL
jgi:hypothetical protein